MSQKSMFPMTLSSAQRISSHRILDHIGEGGIVWAKICGPKFYGPKFYGPKFYGPKFYGPNSYTPKTWKYSFNEIKLSSAILQFFLSFCRNPKIDRNMAKNKNLLNKKYPKFIENTYQPYAVLKQAKSLLCYITLIPTHAHK